jgi:CRP-like cAMP-binding protein
MKVVEFHNEEMKDFKTFIEKYTCLPENDWETIMQAFIRREFHKNEMILEEGKVCRNFYFLENGLLRYFYNIDGNEVVKTFTFPPFCFTSEVSFINQRPAYESIQAIENSTVWQTNYKQYRVLEKLASWNKFMYSLLNEIDRYSKIMIVHLKTQTPEQRYLWLTQNYPQSLLQRIPQKYMASFLGVTPQSLCRIKNKLHNKRKS